tara:strand:+ start:1711 stop:1980 length:270 start_codon:yes stop_codon:yes gene_type:complete
MKTNVSVLSGQDHKSAQLPCYAKTSELMEKQLLKHGPFIQVRGKCFSPSLLPDMDHSMVEIYLSAKSKEPAIDAVNKQRQAGTASPPLL